MHLHYAMHIRQTMRTLAATFVVVIVFLYSCYAVVLRAHEQLFIRFVCILCVLTCECVCCVFAHVFQILIEKPRLTCAPRTQTHTNTRLLGECANVTLFVELRGGIASRTCHRKCANAASARTSYIFMCCVARECTATLVSRQKHNTHTHTLGDSHDMCA